MKRRLSHHNSIRHRFKNKPQPGDDVGSKAAHNLVLVERRMGVSWRVPLSDEVLQKGDAREQTRLETWLGMDRFEDEIPQDDALEPLKE